MVKLTTIILAAGHGKRMKSKLPKVLHQVGGLPMVNHVIDLAQSVESDKIVCVVGHGRELVEKELSNLPVIFVEQIEQLGTGHAVLMADDYINDGEILILFGDAPLLSETTLRSFISFHRENHYKASLISTLYDDTTGYGRIVRDDQGQFVKIVEHKDANAKELLIKEANSGIGLFNASDLKRALKAIQNNNQQGEYYLTDAFENIKMIGGKVGAYVISDSFEVMGVNDRYALSQADKYLQEKIQKNVMLSGVTIVSPQTTYIEKNVIIGQDTIVYPGSILKGTTVIGEACFIGPNADINNSMIKDNVTIKNSTVTDSSVDDYSTIGPYAYLRPKSIVGKHVKIGDFVEVKNSTIGDGSKVSHLTYVGDGIVGKNVNLGCGVVFVNYDGKNKNIIVVEDNAFVGCNTNLIAPVKVGKEAYIAAGSTITDDVPQNALAIARERQVNKANWSRK